jgi:predicted acyl esterase
MGRVRIEVRDSREQYSVRFEDDWPLPGTDYQSLYLDAASGSLQNNRVTNASSIDYEPLSGSGTFRFRFTEDTELTGNMKLKLWVSTEGSFAPGWETDMDLFVGIKKYDADGEEVFFNGKGGYAKAPVALGWLRVSERHLDQNKSTPWQPVLSHANPQLLEPGERVSVEIEILPSSTLFKAGEALEVVVQGRDLFRIPTMSHSLSDSINIGLHTIYTGGDYDSHLLIPVVR